MFVPRALKIDSSLSEDEIENLVYKTEFTTMFHVFIAVATACFIWLFVIKPILGSNKIISVSSSILWLLIVPIIIISTGVLTDSLFNKTDIIFVYAKYVLIWVITACMCIFIGFSYFKKHTTVVNITIIILLVGNMLSAVFTQLIKRKEDEVDITNGVLGLMITAIYVYISYSKGMQIVNNGINYVKFDISLWIVLAYTFFDTLFRSYMMNNSSTMLFFMSSMVLPIISDIVYPYSWLHTRVLSLFMYAMIAVGFGKDDTRILPFYNEQGYMEKADSESQLSIIQGEQWYKILMMVLTSVCILLYIVDQANGEIMEKFIRSSFKKITN